MNNVSPRPRRGAFTGVEGSEGVDDGPGVFCFSGVFSGLAGLLWPTVVFCRLWLGLLAVPVFAGFTLGREVMNAPRTSSSCAVTAIPIAKLQKQTNAKTMTLNRIAGSPYCSIVLNTDVEDNRIASLIRCELDLY